MEQEITTNEEMEFEVRVDWTVTKTYTVKAHSKEDAICKVKSSIDHGDVCVWTDGFEAKEEDPKVYCD